MNSVVHFASEPALIVQLQSYICLCVLYRCGKLLKFFIKSRNSADRDAFIRRNYCKHHRRKPMQCSTGKAVRNIGHKRMNKFYQNNRKCSEHNRTEQADASVNVEFAF